MNTKPRTNDTLTESETDFILWYRSLSEQERNEVYTAIMAEAKKHKARTAANDNK